MGQQDVTLALAGLLKQPPSWLHQLVISLPERDKKALFQTCMQMAMQVLASAPNVLLQLCTQTCAQSHGTRSSVIKQLLTSTQSFVLVVRARGPQPFPIELSRQVTEVRLEYSQTGPVSSWLDWGAMKGSKSLCLDCHITQADVDRLCEALEAGHLPQLKQLRWQCYSFTDHTYSHERFASALGSRITALYVNHFKLFRYLQHLTALHSVEMAAGSRPPSTEEITKLVNHPSLQSVTLIRWRHVGLDLCQNPFKCHELHLVELPTPEVLLRLPITHVKELHIHGALCADTTFGCNNCLRALRFLIDNYLDKVSLIPLWNQRLNKKCFMVINLTADTIHIVRGLKSDCWLVIDWYRVVKSQPQAFLPALWAALHTSISSVRLQYLSGVSWSTFWDGIPHTVKHLELHACEFYCRDKSIPALNDFVAATPEHVESLKLFWLCTTVKDTWVARGVYQVAPKHLDLKLNLH